jgi:hypothetical protein
MRRGIVVLMVVVGFVLQATAFFFLAAPLGTPTAVRFSEPRLPFAPLLFIVGVVLVFSAALVYELLPDRGPDEG